MQELLAQQQKENEFLQAKLREREVSVAVMRGEEMRKLQSDLKEKNYKATLDKAAKKPAQPKKKEGKAGNTVNSKETATENTLGGGTDGKDGRKRKKRSNTSTKGTNKKKKVEESEEEDSEDDEEMSDEDAEETVGDDAGAQGPEDEEEVVAEVEEEENVVAEVEEEDKKEGAMPGEIETDSDKKRAASDEEEECNDKCHWKWAELVNFDSMIYFSKEGNDYYQVPCRACLRLISGKKSTAETAQMTNRKPVHRCHKQPVNGCTFFVCNDCFAKYTLKNKDYVDWSEYPAGQKPAAKDVASPEKETPVVAV